MSDEAEQTDVEVEAHDTADAYSGSIMILDADNACVTFVPAL
jgi:hypothetical protein